jgi:hypothetical protein
VWIGLGGLGLALALMVVALAVLNSGDDNATLELHLKGAPAGAVVELDGRPLGDPAKPHSVKPGKHRLTVVVSGAEVAAEEFTAGRGERPVLNITVPAGGK